MKKKQLFITALLAVSLVGCGPKEVPVTAPAALAVETTTVLRGDISNQFSYSGKIKPVEEANVYSTIGGKVASVSVDVGGVVNAGDVLFQMDTTDITNSINELNASLAASDASVASAQTGINTANGAAMQSQIENAKAAVTNANLGVESAELSYTNAQLAFDNAKTTYDNNVQLYDAGIISKAEMDTIQLAYDNATIALAQAEAGRQKALEAQRQANESYTLIAEKMPQENAQKAQDAYNVAVATRNATAARMASAQKSLRDATVTSPISGVVTSKNVVAGTILSQSAPAFTISDLRTVEVEVGVSEQVINTLAVNDQVQVKITTISDKIFTGIISTLNPAASSNGTYDVKILLDNADGLLKSGMLAEVYFTKEFAPNTIVIPRSAVITKNEESFVYIDENGVAKQVIVTLGIDSGENIEILDGLTEGMNLITKGQTFVADGDAVNVVAKDGIDILTPAADEGENETLDETTPAENTNEDENTDSQDTPAKGE